MSPKMVQCLRPILQKLGFQVSNASNPIYEYIQPKIDIIKSNHLTSWVNNIDVYIHYSLDKYNLLTVYPDKLKPPFVQKI